MDIKNKRLFAKGKRGIIYVGRCGSKKVSVKQQRKDIPVTWSVRNEAEKLKVLNKKGIGPSLLSSGDDFIIYEFVDGIFLPDFIRKSGKERIKRVLLECLRQCFVMDSLELNKEELTNPYKHILVKTEKKGAASVLKVVMLDFERCKSTEKPHNMTQFLQYLASSRISPILNQKGFSFKKEEIIRWAKGYKKNISKKGFQELIKNLLK